LLIGVGGKKSKGSNGTFEPLFFSGDTIQSMTERDISKIESLEFLADEVLALAVEQTSAGATVLALHGDLGTGKTTFVQILAKKLGVVEVVTSPTFMLMKVYELPGVDSFTYFDQRVFKKLVHADMYRIEEVDEMRVLGFEKMLQEKGDIMCIEWAEKITDMLPADTIHLHFSLEGERRSVAIEKPNNEQDS
tara:strand:+ start:2884 stop:3459 length:576 start_codon:yes stop_codon:yes gene_type:complete